MQNRLKWLYDEYVSEMDSENKDDFEHQEFMKNLAMEMVAIEMLMKSEHLKEPYHYKSSNKWKMALAHNKWKWVVYLRLEDEIKDASMDIDAMHKSLINGQMEVHATMKKMAEKRIENAEYLNGIYLSMPYVYGTAEQHKKWDEEYAQLIERHRGNVMNYSV